MRRIALLARFYTRPGSGRRSDGAGTDGQARRPRHEWLEELDELVQGDSVAHGRASCKHGASSSSVLAPPLTPFIPLLIDELRHPSKVGLAGRLLRLLFGRRPPRSARARWRHQPSSGDWQGVSVGVVFSAGLHTRTGVNACPAPR